MTSKAPSTQWLGVGAPMAKPGGMVPMRGSPGVGSGGDTNPKSQWVGPGQKQVTAGSMPPMRSPPGIGSGGDTNPKGHWLGAGAPMTGKASGKGGM